MGYIYQADVWCDDCGTALKSELTRPNYAPPYDSDEYPGAYDEDSETADSPQHCGGCGVPLGTGLTEHGIDYVVEHVRESIEKALEHGRAATWDRIMPAPGTGEDSEAHSYWRGKRHVEILRGWAAKAIADSEGNTDEGTRLLRLFLEMSVEQEVV